MNIVLSDFRAVNESTPDIIARFDLHFRYIYANAAAAAALGLSEEAIIGKTKLEVGLAESKVKRWEKLALKAIQTRQEQLFEFDYPTANEVRYFQSRLIPELDANRSVISILNIIRDVTEARKLEELYKAQHEFKSEKELLSKDYEQLRYRFQQAFERITDLENQNQILRKSQDYFSTLFRFAPNPLAVNRISDMLFVEVNNAFLDQLNFVRDEVIGRTPVELERFDPIEQDDLIDQILEEGIIQQYETLVHDKQGEKHSIVVSSQLVELGGEKCAIASFHDITRRKQAEARLHLLEQAIAASNNAIVIVEANWPVNTITYTNLGFEIMTGYSSEEMTGQNLALLLGPDIEQPEFQLLNEAFEKGHSCQVRLRNYRKDGTLFYIDETISPVKNRHGNLTHFVVVMNDVSARVASQAQLSAEKERLSVTLSSIIDGVITTDTKGRIELVNRVAEVMSGWNQAQASGQYIWDILKVVDPATRQSVSLEPWLHRLLNSGATVKEAIFQPTRRELILQARDGSERYIRLSATPVADGDVLGVVLVFQDITDEQRMAEERLKITQLESLGLLAGGLAHDFNNILTGIQGNLSMVKLSLQQLELEKSPVLAPKPEESKDLISWLEESERACQRAKELTNQLLTFARGGTPIRRRANLADIVVESAQFVVSGSNVQNVFLLPDNLWPVEIDVSQFSQVVQNIVLNAIQATSGAGKIYYEAENVNLSTVRSLPPLREGSYVKLSIRDEGHGIAPKDLPHIFDPYFTTKEKGSGLGLAICYSIIQKHEGNILVTSQPGKGTTFQIYLPAIPGLKATAALLSETQVEQKEIKFNTSKIERDAKRRARVLVMDDEVLIQQLLSRLLTRMGYSVATAASGEQAIEQYSQAMQKGEPFDVLIVDLTIPGGMGGQEAIQHLLKLNPAVKAIVSSGYSNDPVMSNYQEYGFKGLVAKPYRLEELSNVLEQVLNSD
ncbi:MAG TPA: PAS domain S-box protein [Chloroflexia bacterium]|nr:PAS domain S-box protein [Chloroflexia bacterium]